MTPPSPYVQASLATNTTEFYNSLRYCMSDKVIKSIDVVLSDLMTPVEYATLITKHHWREIFALFDSESIAHIRHVPDDLKKVTVFESVLEIASFLRTTTVRPRNIESALMLLAMIIPHFLIIGEDSGSFGHYTGLASFEYNADIYISRSKESGGIPIPKVFDHLGPCVGDIRNPQWIFQDPLWAKILLRSERRILAFRSFLYFSLINCSVADEILENQFEVSRKQLIKHIEMFVDLRMTKGTTSEDIYDFLNRIDDYSYKLHQSSLSAALFNAPFSAFSHTHRQCFGSQYDLTHPRELTKDNDTPEWKMLRDLGEQYAPETIIHSDNNPAEYARLIIQDHFEETWKGPFKILSEEKGIMIPKDPQRKDYWYRSAVLDRLICSAVTRRLIQLGRKDISLTKLMVQEQSHLLLATEDPNESMGMSLVSENIQYHFDKHKDRLTFREQFIITFFGWAWDLMSLSNPENMEPMWKETLNKVPVLFELRALAFTVIEVLNIPDNVDYREYLEIHKDRHPVDRHEFFELLETFCEYLSGIPDENEIIGYLSNFPSLKKTAYLTEWCHPLWLAPFSLIPPE